MDDMEKEQSEKNSNIASYIMRQTGLTHIQMQQIDWKNLGCALEKQKMYLKIRLIKLMQNWLNTSEQK
eukprot:4936924-Ditylum_brightwellii.AAC.1